VCSRAEWDQFVRRFEDAVDEERLRDLVSNAAARIDALIDEIAAWACPPGDAEWVRDPRQRSREWFV
jgi:hypothetical protein